MTLSTSDTSAKRTSRTWPIWLFVGICFGSNLALLPWLLDRYSYGLSEPFVIGFISGECCFVVLVSALMGRTWLSGFIMGAILLETNAAAVMLGLWFMKDWDEFAALLWLPPLLLVAASPLLVLRQLRGWRLIKSHRPIPFRQPLTISTAITDASFEHLQQLRLYSLDLSDSQVTDAGIATLDKSSNLRVLDLSGTQVTSHGFGRWQHSLSSLTLDRTPIDDEGLAAMKQIPNIHSMSLADTKITDVGLMHLVGIVWNTLDLSHTSVSADGIIAAQFKGLHLYVADGQFSDAELVRIQQFRRVEIRDPNEETDE